MTMRGILLALSAMLFVSIIGAVALVLTVRSDTGASALERLERSNPAWEGIGRYERPVPARPVRE
ncbi:hypothetical protein [Azospirillum argentinense]|uniref:Uncharacterized protein n=2 Tax=Azospirillum TaxID=191 RepID=A0A4D8Q6L0_AZOBR|nr:hypothetical protein [Azospirillum argentinense]MBF5093759.1 hypothetical protein [Azospirillum sp. INR13]QCO05885.1 hypothetical protein D3867_28885 [Azospirillum argentinense]